MIETRRDPNIVRSTIPEAKLTWLGRVGDYDYASHNGLEYAVDRYASTPGDYTPGEGELIVMRVITEVFDGSAIESHRTHRAFRVTEGTYTQLAAKAAAKPSTEKPLRAWDVLGGLPALRRREPQRLPTAPASSFFVGALKAQRGNKLDPLPFVEVGGHQPPQRSPAALIEYLASRGIELALANGRLIARSRSPIRADDRELIEKAEELIGGVLRGSPVICSICTELAVSIAFPSAPLCAEHLEVQP